MAVSIDSLRAVATRPVTLETVDGTFVGRVVQEHLSPDSLMLMLEREADTPLVVAIDRITSVAER